MIAMSRLASPLGRVVESGVTDEQASRNTFAARKTLYDAGQAVVLPLDHPKAKGALRAIIEGFAEAEYGPRRSSRRGREMQFISVICGVFSAISLFGLVTDRSNRAAWLLLLIVDPVLAWITWHQS